MYHRIQPDEHRVKLLESYGNAVIPFHDRHSPRQLRQTSKTFAGQDFQCRGTVMDVDMCGGENSVLSKRGILEAKSIHKNFHVKPSR